MKVLIPAGLTKVATMADRGLKLEFHTRELGDDAREMFNLAHTEGWLVYSSTEQEPDATDIPDEKADPGLGTKSPSSRLRACLYVLWEQQGAKGDFETYYRVAMERLIDQVKGKLE